eukprot:jgi/Undpi1/6889/HiC_scaffold_21.g09365.m1
METDGRDVAAQRQIPHAIPSFVGPLVRSRHTKPCPIYFEVSFLDKPQTESSRRLDAIVFRNFYCSHITIKRRRPRRQPQLDTKLDGKQDRGATRSGGIDDDPWVTILRNRPLMEDPHYEDDAQFWHVVTREEFEQEENDAESTEPLRIYVYQPSPLWKTFGLQHVKCVGWSASSVAAPIGEEQHNESTNSIDISRPGARDDGGGSTGGANLGGLCRGISEQVQIFGDRRRDRRLA